MPNKQSVKVVIRTRPTPNFATKNIQIDPINSVSSFFFPYLLRTWQSTSQKMHLEDSSIINKNLGSLNSTR